MRHSVTLPCEEISAILVWQGLPENISTNAELYFTHSRQQRRQAKRRLIVRLESQPLDRIMPRVRSTFRCRPPGISFVVNKYMHSKSVFDLLPMWEEKVDEDKENIDNKYNYNAFVLFSNVGDTYISHKLEYNCIRHRWKGEMGSPRHT